MQTVLDYAGGVPSAASIKSAGHVGAVRYIAPDRTNGGLPGKPVRRSEIDDFDSQGLKMAFVWQYGKEVDADVKRGYAGGVADAKAAQAYLNEIDCPDHPVFFAVDYNMEISEWNSYGVEYFKGAGSVLGKQRVGIYGHSRVCHWAGPEDNVVATVEPGRWLCWVTKGWSGGATGSKYAVLYQRVVDTQRNPGPKVGGVTVDVNDVYHPEWGWRPLDGYQKPRQKVNKKNIHPDIRPNPAHRGDPLFLPMVLKLFDVPVAESPGWEKWGMGDFGQIWGVCVHHTGSNNTSAEFIKHNGNMAGALSSQLHQSRKAPYTMTVVGAGIAWHMGKGSYPGLPTNNANPLLIGIEPQSNGTDPWPEGQLDVYYRTVAAILWYLGHNADRCISHWEYSLVAQGKWDPGAGNGKSGAVMDMDHFRARVQYYIDNPPFMEGINDMALDLTQRYQFRTPKGYYEGDQPGEGTLEDIWLNTDTHAWVARVNTERIIKTLERQHEERLSVDRDLADAISRLADAIR